MINTDSINGHIVTLKTQNPKHYTAMDNIKPEKGNEDVSFINMLKNAVGNVNDLQVESEELTQKMVYNPGSVDVHNVMIAAQKAEIALTLTKTIRDEAIRAFRELMNLR